MVRTKPTRTYCKLHLETLDDLLIRLVFLEVGTVTLLRLPLQTLELGDSNGEPSHWFPHKALDGCRVFTRTAQMTMHL